MNFTWAKAENCFSYSQTYEYKLPLTGGTLSKLLEQDGWAVRVNDRLRRPVFLADKNGVNVKGILAHNVVKASFPSENWQREKESFEEWLGGADG